MIDPKTEAKKKALALTEQHGLASGVGFNDLNGTEQFLVQFLMMLMQLMAPAKDGDTGLTKSISEAFGLKSTNEYNTLREDIRANGRDKVAEGRDYTNLNREKARSAYMEGASLAGINAPQNLNDRQQRVMSVMADAADKAGVNRAYMVGLWGYESSYGKNLKSPTGAQGDFQFTRTTMVETISKNGDAIANNLRERGLNEQADLVQKMHQATKGMSGEGIKSFAANNKTAVDTLRSAPETSTYAAAYYSKSVAQELRLNAMDPANFGGIYAGYNVGVGNAQKVLAGKDISGTWEAQANAGVANGGLASYDKAIASRATNEQGLAFRALMEQPNSGSGIKLASAQRTGETLDALKERAPLKAGFPPAVMGEAAPSALQAPKLQTFETAASANNDTYKIAVNAPQPS